MQRSIEAARNVSALLVKFQLDEADALLVKFQLDEADALTASATRAHNLAKKWVARSGDG
ncbi:hypothetical protein DIPPA_09989 [Diplonema papillatum]|nr:hypothetical protein DIPPA_09989 [Diplonema papillatum]